MAAAHGKIARRYANALLGACKPAQLEEVRSGLDAFAAAWQTDATLRSVMANPAIPLDKRTEVIREVAMNSIGNSELASFLALLVSNARISALPEIAAAFTRLVNDLRKQLTLEVTSAFPLDESERSSVSAKVQKEFGSLASITWGVNPGLIGGVTVRNGDKLLDGSVAGSLERVRTILQG